MIGLDTNLLVRYFVRDDLVQTARVRQILEEELSEEGGGFISLAVVLELVWVLDQTYFLPKPDLIQVLEFLLAADELFVQNADEVSFAMIAFKQGRASFADALISALGSWADCRFTYTFDRKAARLSGFTLA